MGSGEEAYRYEDFTFTAREGQRLEAILRAADFDAYLEVYGPGESDDAVWTSELDELDALQLTEDSDPDALRVAAEKVRAVLADDEPRAVALLRAHLDDDQLRDVGDAVHEARMSSVAPG